MTRVEQQVRLAVRAARAAGLEIRSGIYRTHYVEDRWTPPMAGEPRECCPLGAVLMRFGVRKADRAECKSRTAARSLGVSDSWVNGFIAGFDAIGLVEMMPDERDGFLLGAELRDEWMPKLTSVLGESEATK